eukprot:scaffold128733_cov22-Tisochrysis_lutea.AAC.1
MAGRKIVKEGGEDTYLPHRKCMTAKELPILDCKLTKTVDDKVKKIASVTGAVIISDGWTSVANKPVINALALAALPLGSYFLTALDTRYVRRDEG